MSNNDRPWVREHRRTDGPVPIWHHYAEVYGPAACGHPSIPGMPLVAKQVDDSFPKESVCDKCFKLTTPRSTPALGSAVMDLIAEAFGLSINCTRVVIDLRTDCVARIIRVDYLTEDQAKALVESLKRCNTEVV